MILGLYSSFNHIYVVQYSLIRQSVNFSLDQLDVRKSEEKICSFSRIQKFRIKLEGGKAWKF